jgi:nucleoside-diphosphate-sugar epimerase
LKIFVTGASGFIGSNLVPKLIGDNHDVHILERYVTGRYVLGEKKDVKTYFGDLREYFSVKRIIYEIQPDVVINLASISPVSYSYDHPIEVNEANFLATINLAEACLREVHNFKHFLFASTSETYGNGPNPKKEDTPQFPNSPYAVSKHAAEKYLLYLRDACGFPVTILRNFNTYGRKENTHFVVERTIVQMLQQNTVRLGDPNPIRDLIYVDDHVNSYITCLNNPKAKGEIFNFCTGKGVSIKGLVDLTAKLADFRGEVIWNSIPSRPLDILELVGDQSKARKILGWTPKFQLAEGLKLTIDFWRKKLQVSR